LTAQFFGGAQRGYFRQLEQDIGFMRPRRQRSIFLPADKNFGDFRKSKITVPAAEF
jgi:hypothetical protein